MDVLRPQNIGDATSVTEINLQELSTWRGELAHPTSSRPPAT